MKRIVLVAVTSFVSFAVSAQSSLRVSLSDHSKLTVEVDYKHFQKVGTSITVGDLPEGRHQIRIFEMRDGLFGRQVQNLIYDGKVKTYRGRITLFELDPESGGINVYDEDLDSFQVNPTIQNDGQAATAVQPDKAVGAAPVQGAMADAKMTGLKAKVDAINTDSRKMTAIKDGLTGEHLSSAQVSEIMKWLGFESSKEEFAEWAFPIVVDPNNYGSLMDQFSYKEYQDQFQSFLGKH